MKRPIIFLSTAIVLLAFSFVPAAYAGFEWMPPAQNPAPVPAAQPQYQDQVAPAQNRPPMTNSVAGFPAAPVESQHLGIAAPTPIVPKSYQQPVPRQQVRNLSGGSGLVIDPYPLRNLDAHGNLVELSEDSVQQAMAEEARLLNPLKLGAGLKTGAQPRKAVMPSANIGRVPRGPYDSIGGSSGGLTPMAGGEPAPLPGTAGQMGSPATPRMHYAQAVGFGRDLPLALALSQVIPSEFTHSYAAGVDAGIFVSWKGGKAWNEVLNDMLRPHNLMASIQGHQVIIQPVSKL